ncbi:MAG: hypothetical protein ACR2I5_00935 [Candidatus Limnocylindria bacterium]
MIGTRAAFAIGLATIGLVLLLGSGGSDPGIAITAQRMVAERAVEADAALAALELGMAPALDAARRAGARVVAGDEEAGPLFGEAATLLSDLDSRAVRDAVARLDGARQAATPGAPRLGAPVESGELASIAAQLDGTAGAADTFVVMRRRAERLAGALDDGLGALERGDVAAAADHVAAAREDHGVVAGWDVGLPTLPLWIDTMDAMIGAMERLVTATRDDDADAASAAASHVASVGDDAATADRALRIAISEGGAAVSSAPLGRLADVLGRVREARATMALILQTAGR